MDYSIFSISGLLRFCIRFKLIIITNSILAIIISSIVALYFLPVKYKSTAVISPTTTSSITQALLIEDNPYKKDIFEFGEDETIEQLMQVLTSDIARDLVVEYFNLYETYEINLFINNIHFHFLIIFYIY